MSVNGCAEATFGGHTVEIDASRDWAGESCDFLVIRDSRNNEVVRLRSTRADELKALQRALGRVMAFLEAS